MMDSAHQNDGKLQSLKNMLDRRERQDLSPLATLSGRAVRRRPESRTDHRQNFALDVDRILHSRAYTRYIDKTQVFYMIDNDHITHRVLHVQLVSKISRTVGRFLGLNEDLIEAIALGHDIGHPPFGHDGEKELARLCSEHGLDPFQHNVQSVRFLDVIERGGEGWNLALQTLDGILCHDGEVHDRCLRPERGKDFTIFDREMSRKSGDPTTRLAPMTLEGCVVRFCDTIAYIGRDIEDAIELGLIERRDIPRKCRQQLGDTNGSIVYRLVEDVIMNSISVDDGVSFSPAVADGLLELKKFNYERIYMEPRIKTGLDKIRKCYQVLFANYLEHLVKERQGSDIFTEFIDPQTPGYLESHEPAARVRDFMAGMTDDYFLRQARLFGCEVPVKK